MFLDSHVLSKKNAKIFISENRNFLFWKIDSKSPSWYLRHQKKTKIQILRGFIICTPISVRFLSFLLFSYSCFCRKFRKKIVKIVFFWTVFFHFFLNFTKVLWDLVCKGIQFLFFCAKNNPSAYWSFEEFCFSNK